MSLLQFFVIVSGVLFAIMAIDAYQRKKLNFLHFLVFFWWTWVLILFAFDINLLNKFWQFFGVARGADLIVYISIILLFWFYFELLNKKVKQDLNFTKFVTNDAIDFTVNYRRDFWKQFIFEVEDKLKNLKQDFKNEFLFLVRAYNEEKTIWDVIDQIFSRGFSKILVVNDWSTDRTLEVLKQKQEEYKDKILIVLSHLINRWGGAANKTWIEFIKRFGDRLDIAWVVTFDADWQMNINDFENFIGKIEELKSKSDSFIFVGSRFIRWGEAKWMPFFRKIILFWSKIITLIFNWIWVSDPHNGYRVLPLDFIKKINLTSDWMTYASELLEETKRLWYKIVEVPVNIIYTDYSLSKWQKNLNAIKILLELIYKKLFYK